MIDVQQHNLFDYASLDTDTRAFVQDKAQAIHTRLKRTAEDIIAIGQDLLEVKARLGHGQFMNWVSSEFDMGRQTAQNFMNVAVRFGDKLPNFGNLAISVLYTLAAPSTPDTIIEQVEAGTIPPTLAAIREAKRTEEIEVQDVSINSASPPTWGLVDGKPFTAPLSDGKPVKIPDSGKLPPSVHTSHTNELSRATDIEEETITPPFPVPALRGVPPALQMSESNEWYTPALYVDAARELMGGVDCDPASNAYANSKVVRATTYYDITTNGLAHDWIGRVWLNPPYGRDNGDSNQETWSRRLLEQYEAGITTEAVLLVNAVTDRKWFQPLWQFPICFTDHRIRFYNQDTEAGQPTHGNALIYLGSQIEQFITLFKPFGAVVRRVG